MTTIQIFCAGVLAGTHRGSDVSPRGGFRHALADHSFAVGRLRRAAREAFCDKTLDLVGRVGWEPASAIDCPRCRDIADRLLGPTASKFRSGQFVWVEAREGDRRAEDA